MHRCEGERIMSIKGGCLYELSLKGAAHIWCKEAIGDIPPQAESHEEWPPPESV